MKLTKQQLIKHLGQHNQGDREEIDQLVNSIVAVGQANFDDCYQDLKTLFINFLDGFLNFYIEEASRDDEYNWQIITYQPVNRQGDKKTVIYEYDAEPIIKNKPVFFQWLVDKHNEIDKFFNGFTFIN